MDESKREIFDRLYDYLFEKYIDLFDFDVDVVGFENDHFIIDLISYDILGLQLKYVVHVKSPTEFFITNSKKQQIQVLKFILNENTFPTILKCIENLVINFDYIENNVNILDSLLKLGFDYKTEKYEIPIYLYFHLLLIENYKKSPTKFNNLEFYIQTIYDNRFKQMEKTLSKYLFESFDVLARDTHEYSIAIDFERKLISPERFVVLRGGRKSTKKIDDFEMFGHTHPDANYPTPSKTDIKNLDYNIPEFIVAGTSGSISIIKLTNIEIYSKWLIDSSIYDGHSHPLECYKNITFKNYGIYYNPAYLYETDASIKFPKMFYDLTGVEFSIYKKNMKIIMCDNPIKEKKVPTIDESEFMSKFQN